MRQCVMVMQLCTQRLDKQVIRPNYGCDHYISGTLAYEINSGVIYKPIVKVMKKSAIAEKPSNASYFM